LSASSTPSASSASSASSAASRAAAPAVEGPYTPTVIAHVARLSIEQKRPINLHFYEDSIAKTCFIGVSGESKRLERSDTDFSPPIQSIMRINEEMELVIMTENSIYVVSSEIPVRRTFQPVTEVDSS